MKCYQAQIKEVYKHKNFSKKYQCLREKYR